MNPSTEDIMKAVDKVNADTIFVLPNNSNIILAAEQAKSLVEDIDAATEELVDALVDEDSELISIYYGEDVSSETAEALAAKLEEKYPDVDVELQNGGQPIYYYVLSVE